MIAAWGATFAENISHILGRISIYLLTTLPSLELGELVYSDLVTSSSRISNVRTSMILVGRFPC